MPIDPTIVTGLMPQVSQAVQSQQPSAAMIAAQEAVRKSQDERRKEQEVRSILGSDLDDDEKINRLNRINAIEIATKYRAQLDDHRGKVDQAFLNDLKKDEAQTALFGKILQGVKDQYTLDGAKQLGQAFGEDGQKLVSLLPDQWDDATSPQFLQSFIEKGLSAEQYTQQQQKSYDTLMKGDWDRGTAGLFATADTPQEAQGVLTMLQARRAPKSLLDYWAPRVQAWTPDEQKRAQQEALTADEREKAAKTPAAAAGFTLSPGQKRFDAEGKEIASVAPKPVAAGGGSGSGGDTNDAKAIASAIISGDQPPSLTGLYRFAAPVRAELARKGYDLTRATEDWTATQKYLNTLNGAQQTRLRQAVNFTQESIPLIRQLVTEWDSAGLPLLSKANLEAAASGVYGNKQQSLANRLKGQIADLTSELGTVYKGGNSSTDESLKLAAENLKANWSKRAALDALTQIEKNLQFRQNSIKNVGPVGGRESNPYAPAATQGGAIPEGTEKPVPGHPGVIAVYRGGRWIVK